MPDLPSWVCRCQDHHARSQVNPRNYCQSEHPEPGRCRSLLCIVSTDFAALLSRRSQVRTRSIGGATPAGQARSWRFQVSLLEELWPDWSPMTPCGVGLVNRDGSWSLLASDGRCRESRQLNPLPVSQFKWEICFYCRKFTGNNAVYTGIPNAVHGIRMAI